MKFRSIIKKNLFPLLILIFIFSPVETLNEVNYAPHQTPFPVQKEWGAMDILKNGGTIKIHRTARPKALKGLYMTGWTAGLDRFSNYIKIAKETEINTFIIDIKDATGYLSYESTVPLSKDINSSIKKISNIQKIVAQCKENGIYPVARIVVFKDPLLAAKRKDLVIKKSNGAIYYDRSNISWVDPYSETVWQYNVDIAEEAISMGFEEIQIDYIRFPAVPNSIELLYPYNKKAISKEDNIQLFLKYATDRIHKYGVKVEVDIFGLVLSATDDLGIGQNLEKIATYADYLCPMVYPSHYAQGSYGIKDPGAYPYETILKTLQDGIKRLKTIDSKCELIPYLQDFSLYHFYGKNEVQLQKKAVYDNGIADWFLWNAANIYTIDALEKE